MDAIAAALSSGLSSASIAAFGPAGPLFAFMAWIFYQHIRGREERLAVSTEKAMQALREEQKELFQQQQRDIQGLRVDVEAERARRIATEALCEKLRINAFAQYTLCRAHAHDIANLRTILIAAKVKTPSDFPELVWPTLPPTA